MSQIESFRVILLENKKFYRSGEDLFGKVVFKVNNRLQINEINISMIGNIQTKFLNESEKDFSSKETHLKTKTVLLSQQDDTNLYLEEREYSFEFNYIVPDDMPNSFFHPFGSIFYFIEANIVATQSEFSESDFVLFEIQNDVDLNKFPLNLNKLFEIKESKDYFVTGRGLINAVFSINKRGFLSGEKMICSARLDNKSNRDIIRSRIKLIEEINFIGSYIEDKKLFMVKTISKDIINIIIDKVIREKTSDYAFHNKVIQIPSACISSNGLSKIIEVNYFVVFEYNVLGLWYKHEKIPIKIGTIPLIRKETSNIENKENKNEIKISSRCHLSGRIQDDLNEIIILE